ncbi:putative cryptochrome [Cercophora scortea]|uniref:Cryptochrome DASH n=1 Tax=Cercophora scortea TaxID=314031 RepID=A0AAE0J4K1_9PEZI|nr:putative cryptochrome [Cercophora scortea]
MAQPNILVYLLRRDLRVSDNPILHHLSTSSDHGFTHFLPLCVLPANQIELSGFIKDGGASPFPEAKSSVGRYWRCGPHRAKFLGESVWDVKQSLEAIGSGLAIRVGMVGDTVKSLLGGLKNETHKVGAVWMTGCEGTEEKRDENDVASICKKDGVKFKVWTDEKYLIDDRDVNVESPEELPDIFTTYRKSAEPLREKPRAVLPTPEKGSLPPFPALSAIPSQTTPFSIPETREDLVESLVKPVKAFLPNIPPFPENATSAHPFEGGESVAQTRLNHLVQSEGMKNYKDTRNGLIGTEFSTKLSAYLALGCVTSRQIHHILVGYEDGTNKAFESVDGYGGGENEGTKAIRFELLWRDYMRLCHQKFKHKLFRLEGFKSGADEYKEGDKKIKWKFPDTNKAPPTQEPDAARISKILERFLDGTTGMGLIDASQRELIHTGYTSNRARQNVASFLAKHLGIDWRYGAEWYEMLLVDYDVSSNWANWQYVSGVGNDPRGELRIFNPVKQAFDYDKDGSYVRSWVPEVSKLEKLENLFQAWTASEEDLRAAGLEGNVMVTDPVKRIEFSVDGKPAKPNKRPFFRRRGQGRGGVDGATGKESMPPSGSDESQGNSPSAGAPASENGADKPPRPPYRATGAPRGRGGGHRGQQRGYHGTRGGGGRPRGRYAPPGQGHHHHWEAAPLQSDV